MDLKITPSDQTIVKPTALGPGANTDTKLLIYGLFQKGRVLAQDAVNPDALDSPMAIIKATLTDLLNEHARSQAEMLRAQQDQSRVSAHTRTSLYLSRATIYLTNHLLRSSLSR